MNPAPAKGCTVLQNLISEEIDGKRVVKQEWKPLAQLISGMYALDPSRNWTYCMRGSKGKELFMRPVQKSKCNACRYAAR